MATPAHCCRHLYGPSEAAEYTVQCSAIVIYIVIVLVVVVGRLMSIVQHETRSNEKDVWSLLFCVVLCLLRKLSTVQIKVIVQSTNGNGK